MAFATTTNIEALKSRLLDGGPQIQDEFLFGPETAMLPVEIQRMQKSAILDVVKTATELDDLYMIIRKAERGFFFYCMRPNLTIVDYARVIAESWIDAEYPAGTFGRDSGVNYFTGVPRNLLMDATENAAFDALPKTVTIYRGLSDMLGRRKVVRGFSWTIDRTIAEFFATRYGTGKLYRATIDKEGIYFLTMGRDESEVVVEPMKLKSVRQIT